MTSWMTAAVDDVARVHASALEKLTLLSSVLGGVLPVIAEYPAVRARSTAHVATRTTKGAATLSTGCADWIRFVEGSDMATGYPSVVVTVPGLGEDFSRTALSMAAARRSGCLLETIHRGWGSRGSARSMATPRREDQARRTT